jgi:cation transport regulator ChaB
MPREDKTEIPSTIQRSDKHAQQIWEKAHDSAVETYGEGGRAHRVAYAALKHEYEKKGDKLGQEGRECTSASTAQRTRAASPIRAPAERPKTR